MMSTAEIEAAVGRLYLTILDRDKTIADLQTALQATMPAPPKVPSLLAVAQPREA